MILVAVWEQWMSQEGNRVNKYGVLFKGDSFGALPRWHPNSARLFSKTFKPSLMHKNTLPAPSMLPKSSIYGKEISEL